MRVFARTQVLSAKGVFWAPLRGVQGSTGVRAGFLRRLLSYLHVRGPRLLFIRHRQRAGRQRV